jgi:hypothetical protein
LALTSKTEPHRPEGRWLFGPKAPTKRLARDDFGDQSLVGQHVRRPEHLAWESTAQCFILTEWTV